MNDYTTKEAARELKCSEQYIRHRIKTGKLKNVRRCRCGQSWLIRENELIKLVQSKIRSLYLKDSIDILIKKDLEDFLAGFKRK